MAPAMSSASPPRMTSLVSPSAVRPAVSAKGTVRPSDRPRIASETILALRRRVQPDQGQHRDGSVCLSETETPDSARSRDPRSVEAWDETGWFASRSAPAGIFFPSEHGRVGWLNALSKFSAMLGMKGGWFWEADGGRIRSPKSMICSRQQLCDYGFNDEERFSARWTSSMRFKRARIALRGFISISGW